MVPVMAYFEVIAVCPLHKKNVYIRVKAADGPAAIKKAVGISIACPWGPIDEKGVYIRGGHSFVVGSTDPKKQILGVTPLPWLPAAIVSSAPSLTALPPEPTTPLETLYYIKVGLPDQQLVKAQWWKK